ncbi:DUF4124 domain-containing protein [Panacagrimonas sp.]|uniref:DUF4124 domain-containing protein n=1 Tax=Panacagrimonas sp. TaxID=2480088 RepID=UPI003B51C4F1
MKPVIVALLLALVPSLHPGLVPPAAAATVYRWVDANGQVHFGQVPPRGTAYDVIEAHGAPRSSADEGAGAAPAASEPSMQERTRQFLQRREAENKAREEAEAKAKQEKETAQRKCREARDRVAFLEERTARRLVIPADDGNLARMEEDEFMRRLNAAKEQADTHCR